VKRKWVRKRILNHDQEEDMSSTQQDHQEARAGPATDFDAVIVGAGFSGLYMPHSLRNEMGLSARVYEAVERRRRDVVLEPLSGRPQRLG
jgi:ribulose 1,5-bisphosphate synthetase/thiazole synthase